MSNELEKTKGRDLLRGQHFIGRQLLMPAVKIALFPLLMGLVSMIVAPILMSEIVVLRIALNVLIVVLMGALLLNSGAVWGEKDAQNSVRLMQMKQKGTEPSAQELSEAYHPMKGILAALLGALPWVVMGVLLALLARPYTYTLQDLPSYLSYYLNRADLGGALSFYQVQQSLAVADVLRILVRLAIMPFVYMGGTLSNAASLTLDRISPLLVLILPALYAIGYLLGPKVRLQNYLRNQEAKKQHAKKVKRKQRKERAARQQKKPEQLI